MVKGFSEFRRGRLSRALRRRQFSLKAKTRIIFGALRSTRLRRRRRPNTSGDGRRTVDR